MTACAAPGEQLETSVPVSVVKTAVPIHEPVYSFDADKLVGLTDDHRIASIDDAGGTELSENLGDTGRNLQIMPDTPGVVLVPQPMRGHVLEVRIADLQPISTLSAGPQPSYLSQDSGLGVLLALSANRSTVSAVNLQLNQMLGSQPVLGGQPSTTLEGAQRGRAVEFHVSGPTGVRHYKGHDVPADMKGELSIDVAAAVSDPTKVSRIYLAEAGTGRLLAVDSERGGTALEVVGEVSLGEPIRWVGVDDTRIYAATESELTVLKSNSFGGYSNGQIPVLRTFDYRGAMPPGPVRSAALAGGAVGRHQVYLALESQPYVVQVAKPRV